jgi:hypothetical protein
MVQTGGSQGAYRAVVRRFVVDARVERSGRWEMWDAEQQNIQRTAYATTARRQVRLSQADRVACISS